MTPPTTGTFAEFKKLVDAEDYLQFFGIPYDQQFVNVNRLHILKQFALSIEEIDKAYSEATPDERLERYGLALRQAYETFQGTTPQDTKLFKVFKEQPKNVVLVKDIGTGGN